MLIPGQLSLCICDRLLKWDSAIRGQVRRQRLFHEHKNMSSSVSLSTGSKSSYRPGEMEGSEIQGGWGKPEPWKVLSEHLLPSWQTLEGRPWSLLPPQESRHSSPIEGNTNYSCDCSLYAGLCAKVCDPSSSVGEAEKWGHLSKFTSLKSPSVFEPSLCPAPAVVEQDICALRAVPLPAPSFPSSHDWCLREKSHHMCKCFLLSMGYC